jgi:hypothetical protein
MHNNTKTDSNDNYEDELEQYLKLKPTSLALCPNPICWWLDRTADYPNLYRMALDYLIVRGMLTHH